MNFSASILKRIFPLCFRGKIIHISLAAILLSLSGQGTARCLAEDLTEMSLEELMKIEVVTVSKKGERLFGAPAAIFNITHEDIDHAGIRSLPEAMRLAPGMQVGYVDANKWAISARGYNMLFANKLLVLQDGRSIYSRIFSGVCWEAQDVLFADVDRIEIIRGPGATLWGANAVNGVINIITKSAMETQGGYLGIGIGTEEKKSVDFRYGSRLKEKVWYRIYGKYADHGPLAFSDGSDADDSWRTFHGGFKMDIPYSTRNRLMFTGEGYSVHAGQNVDPDYFDPDLGVGRTGNIRVAGGHVLGRWEHLFSQDSDCALQWFADYYRRDDPLLIGGEYKQIDLDFQHRFRLGERHEVIWGTGYRFTADRFENTKIVHYDPSRRTYHLYNAFLQDEIGLMPDRLHLTVGTKLEWTDDTGFHAQPNVRLRWSPTPRQTFWGAVSRAVRTPSRSDRDVRLVRYLFSDEDMKTWALMEGSDDLPVETLDAFEVGYRFSMSNYLWTDMAAFYNKYQHLRTFGLGEPFVETEGSIENVYIPFIAGAGLEGESAGFETALELRPFTKGRMRLSYSYFQLRLYPESEIINLRADDAEEESPKHQFTVLLSADPVKRLTLNVTCRFVDRLDALSIKRYLTADFNLGYRITRAIKLNLIGKNLFDSPHMEFFEKMTPFERLYVKRSFLLTSSVEF